MSLTGIDLNTSDADFRSVVLHQFGHSLGFVHEHQVPDAGIPWDTGRVYKYYSDTYDWDSTMTYNNVLFRYQFSETNGSKFDKNSIMIYAIPKGLCKDRSYFLDWTYDLSDVDKRIVAGKYR